MQVFSIPICMASRLRMSNDLGIQFRSPASWDSLKLINLLLMSLKIEMITK